MIAAGRRNGFPLSQKVSPKIACLNSVSWLDVNGVLRNVPAGTYIPYARVLFERPSSPVNHILRAEMGATVLDSNGEDAHDPENPLVIYQQTSHLQNLVVDIFGTTSVPLNRWITLELPELTIGQSSDPHMRRPFSDVRIWIRDHSTDWKSGFSVDVVGLERVREDWEGVLEGSAREVLDHGNEGGGVFGLISSGLSGMFNAFFGHQR
ncbi:hypothetical protein HDU76_011137 [Blyttiomyces sp. JEL0837]|nr:hypothetical protein HDU76_011137 [Blyttiomyces sp. JEL0837]